MNGHEKPTTKKPITFQSIKFYYFLEIFTRNKLNELTKFVKFVKKKKKQRNLSNKEKTIDLFGFMFMKILNQNREFRMIVLFQVR